MIKRIIRFKQVSSTQDTAKKFVQKHEELAISSLYQKRGRGRHGRLWYSPSGGLYVSFLLFPKTRITSIPLLASLTIVKVLEKYGFSRLAIFWPNDVFLNNKKVCGIICEQFKNSIICGIGLNVNIEQFGRKLSNATSLKIEAGRDFDLDEVLKQIVGVFNPLYNELQQKGFKVKEVLNYVKGIGEPVEIVTCNEVIEGTVYNIDDDWALLLRDHSGMIKKFYYGDVRQLLW